MTDYRRFGHTIKEHHLEVPWDYSNPHGTFGLYAREIIWLSDKMCVCYRRVAGLDVAFLDAD